MTLLTSSLMENLFYSAARLPFYFRRLVVTGKDEFGQLISNRISIVGEIASITSRPRLFKTERDPAAVSPLKAFGIA
jgi:hypothetical protein